MSAATPSVAPRRLHRRRASGVHVMMLVAGTLGLVFTLAVLRDAPGDRRVAVAARDLVAGTVLRRTDLRFEPVAADDRLIAHFVEPRDLSSLAGRVLTRSVVAGEPLIGAQLRPVAAPQGRRAMSIPVERARAVNGRLAPGDRVDVVVARDGVVAVVVAGAEVLDVDDGDGGVLGRHPGEVSVTLAVDVQESQLLAAALADGDFVLTRVTGAMPATGAPPLTIGPPGP